MPLPSKEETLTGWGQWPQAGCRSYRPEKQRDLPALLRQNAGPLLARGLGRAYGDAALQPSGIIHTERLDHFIEFDAAQGIVRAQAGVTLSDLMALAIPRGWLPPAIPGTRHVTLGGAFACNIHGKNHWREGDFADHVLSIRLMLASGDVVECSPSSHSDIFWATAGGMGMTGVIEEITLRLKPIGSSSLRTITYRVDSISDMVGAFEQYRESSDYMVGWIDHLGTGEQIGRGVFESASHVTTAEGGAPLEDFTLQESGMNVPFFMPPMLLNRYSMALYNRKRFKKYSATRQSEMVGFNGFFHPLDAIGQWNRLYGKRGFFQYQCLLPESPGVDAQIGALLSLIQQKKSFSFLAVIKYHRDGQGLLTFPKRGYSVALDFPNTKRVRALLPQLDAWVAEHGGRIYLAKDALLSPELFRRMYGQQASDWLDLIHDIDPNGAFSSLMCERLKWKENT